MSREIIEQEIRQTLWLSHGCLGLYGDDGEMQCGACLIDFKRDSFQRIADRISVLPSERLQADERDKEQKLLRKVMACGHVRANWNHRSDCGWFMPGLGECDSGGCYCMACQREERERERVREMSIKAAWGTRGADAIRQLDLTKLDEKEKV
ncbi:hypothetical protein LCGC14_1773410 [marine sediment metagenome]|uniref:Uncharacterized protein n=1 Tax=marine sediment metagenome TaxID=412755 RepID=A0A0F9GXJ0_9ZZZZ